MSHNNHSSIQSITRRPLRRIAAFALVGVLALALAPAPAAACTVDAGAVPYCSPGQLFLREGASLPANTPGIQITTRTTEGVSILDASGAAIPIAVTPTSEPSLSVIALREPLTPGADYTVRYREFCFGEPTDAGAGNPVDVRFHAAAPATLPTSLGTVSVAVTTEMVRLPARASGSCDPPPMVPAAVARLRVEPSAELRAFEPTTHLTASFADSTLLGGMSSTSFEPLILREALAAACSPSATLAAGVATQGRHRVVVRAHIAGASTDPPPVEVDVDFVCSGTPTTPPPSGDAGLDEGPPPRSAAGCSVTSRGPRRGALGLGAGIVGLTLAAARRRRRTQRRCHT